MRMIGNILLRDNLLEHSNIALLCKQIEHYLSNNAESADCFSLIPVLDLVMPILAEKNFQEADLRQKGFILSIKELKEASNNVCELADTDPFIYNSRLKRLHEAYAVFTKNYAKGFMRNDIAEREMISRFHDTLRSSYIGVDPLSKRMSQELQEQVKKLLEVEVENINRQWLDRRLNKEIKNKEIVDNELTNLFEGHLLADWRRKKLPAGILTELEEIRNNSTALQGDNDPIIRLLYHFKNKKLNSDIQKMITEATINELILDINCEKITAIGPLGQAYVAEQKPLLGINLEARACNNLINHWQTNQLTHQAALELQSYVTKIIERKINSNELGLIDQFDKIAVEIFIENVRGNKYLEEFMSIVRNYAEEKGKIAVLQNKDCPVCTDEIFNKAMNKLYALWLSKELSPEKCTFIQEIVFAELRELDGKIKDRIWRGEAKLELVELRAVVAEMRQEMNILRNANQPANQAGPGYFRSIGTVATAPVSENKKTEETPTTTNNYNY